jgi:DnaJ-class molecular chaperone
MITLPLPALVEAPCPDCQGYGGWNDEHGPLMCFTCCGTGKVERCSGCHEQPTVINGTDVCGCSPEVLWAMEHTPWFSEAA